MPISLVTALPTAKPPTTPGAVATDSAEGAVADFAALLLGQLTTGLPLSGDAAGDTLLNTDGEHRSEDDTPTAADQAATDPLALLAALTQIPVESRAIGSAQPSTDDGETLKGLMPKEMRASPSGEAIAHSAPFQAQNSVLAESTSMSALPASAAAKSGAAIFAVPEVPFGQQLHAAQGEPKPLQVATGENPPFVPLVHPAPLPAHTNEADSTLTVRTPFHTAAWNDDFSQKVVWVASSRQQEAALTLNPPSLGSIEIALRLDKDTATATATFVSASAEVRDSIESALPRLREMLAGAGIALGQANVSAESFRQTQHPQGETASRRNGDNAILGADTQAVGTTLREGIRRGSGLVDMFV